MYLPLVQSNAYYLTGWLDRNKWSQLFFAEGLGQVAVLYVPIPRCSRLSALNMNFAECDNFNIRDLRGKYGINIPLQMVSLKDGSLAEFLALKLKMSSIIWVYAYDKASPEAQTFIMVLGICKILSNPLQEFS